MSEFSQTQLNKIKQTTVLQSQHDRSVKREINSPILLQIDAYNNVISRSFFVNTFDYSQRSQNCHVYNTRSYYNFADLLRDDETETGEHIGGGRTELIVECQRRFYPRSLERNQEKTKIWEEAHTAVPIDLCKLKGYLRCLLTAGSHHGGPLGRAQGFQR